MRLCWLPFRRSDCFRRLRPSKQKDTEWVALRASRLKTLSCAAKTSCRGGAPSRPNDGCTRQPSVVRHLRRHYAVGSSVSLCSGPFRSSRMSSPRRFHSRISSESERCDERGESYECPKPPKQRSRQPSNRLVSLLRLAESSARANPACRASSRKRPQRANHGPSVPIGTRYRRSSSSPVNTERLGCRARRNVSDGLALEVAGSPLCQLWSSSGLLHVCGRQLQRFAGDRCA